MRQDEAFFGSDELLLVYIAKRLNEAQKLEDVLTAAGLDYLVEPDTYRGGVIFPSERVGAFFYVAEPRLAEAQALLREGGYRPYEAGS